MMRPVWGTRYRLWFRFHGWEGFEYGDETLTVGWLTLVWE